MSAPWHHAVSSAKKFGGIPEDYTALHTWFDETKELVGDFRHRALRHHLTGVAELERTFGMSWLVQSTGRTIPTRWVGEQHLLEDFGKLPTLGDWLRCIQPQPWMTRTPPMEHE